jgi:hypothetical protein
VFISKRKLELKLREERAIAYERQQEHEQWDRITELEQQVKKLKKTLLKLEGMIKNGY